MDIFLREQEKTANSISTLRLYDIEPNKYREKDLPRRSRFYQSLIDSKLLPTDIPYEELPDVITIWILPFDPFGCDRMVYTVKNMVAEENHIVYNDGIIKLFLYTKGTKGGSKELKNLLTYMEHTTAENAVDKDLQEIQGIVENVKSKDNLGGRYMTLQEMINYEKRDSRIEGAILTCKFLGLDINQTKDSIIKQYKLPESMAEYFLDIYWNTDASM